MAGLIRQNSCWLPASLHRYLWRSLFILYSSAGKPGMRQICNWPLIGGNNCFVWAGGKHKNRGVYTGHPIHPFLFKTKIKDLLLIMIHYMGLMTLWYTLKPFKWKNIPQGQKNMARTYIHPIKLKKVHKKVLEIKLKKVNFTTLLKCV